MHTRSYIIIQIYIYIMQAWAGRVRRPRRINTQYYYIMCKECISSSTVYTDYNIVRHIHVASGRRGSVGGRPGVPSIHYLRRYPNCPATSSAPSTNVAAIAAAAAHSTRVPVRARYPHPALTWPWPHPFPFHSP